MSCLQAHTCDCTPAVPSCPPAYQAGGLVSPAEHALPAEAEPVQESPGEPYLLGPDLPSTPLPLTLTRMPQGICLLSQGLILGAFARAGPIAATHEIVSDGLAVPK